MTENETNTCLFVGGSADGKRIAVDDPTSKFEYRSIARVPETHEIHFGGDPKHDKLAVVETYLPLRTEHEGKPATVFALNVLTDESIEAQLTKHFGVGTSFTR